MKNFIKRVKRYRETYYSRRLLRNLDVHALKDIGLSRTDALREAGRPFWDNSAHDLAPDKTHPVMMHSTVSLVLVIGFGLTVYLGV